MNPLVSIILPTYNGAAIISRAIASVLAQDYKNWELIIVSDGSTDETKNIVENFSKTDPRILFVENEQNMGIQKTLNKGLSYAQGIYIARIDDDDQWIDPLKLSAQVDFLEKNTEHVLVGTNAIICDQQGREIGRYSMPTSNNSIRSRMLIKNCFLHPTIMARKEAVLKVGSYSEQASVQHIEDYDLWLRLGCVGKIANIAIPAVSITIHTGSVTFQNRIVQARRVWAIVGQYKKKYPNFVLARMILSLRISGFATLKILPVPKKLLYKIQELYKKF